MATVTQIKITIVVLGKIASGKTTLISTFKGRTNFESEPTIGGIYGIQDVTPEFIGLQPSSQNRMGQNQTQVRLCIWDTTGNERYSAILPSYVRKASVVVLCFEGNDLADLKKRIEVVRKETDAPIILTATKRDLISPLTDDLTEIRRFFGLGDDFSEGTPTFPIFETSAYTGMGVHQVFQYAAKTGYGHEVTKAVDGRSEIVTLVRGQSVPQNSTPDRVEVSGISTNLGPCGC